MGHLVNFISIVRNWIWLNTLLTTWFLFKRKTFPHPWEALTQLCQILQRKKESSVGFKYALHSFAMYTNKIPYPYVIHFLKN